MNEGMAQEQPRPGLYLKRLRLEDLTENDMRWLIRGTDVLQDGTKPKHLMEDTANGLMQLWRVEGAAKGILATQLIRKPNWKVLEIFMVAGEGIFPQYGRALLAECRDVARHMGAERIYCGAQDPRLQRFYEKKLNMVPADLRFTTEV